MDLFYQPFFFFSVSPFPPHWLIFFSLFFFPFAKIFISFYCWNSPGYTFHWFIYFLHAFGGSCITSDQTTTESFTRQPHTPSTLCREHANSWICGLPFLRLVTNAPLPQAGEQSKHDGFGLHLLHVGHLRTAKIHKGIRLICIQIRQLSKHRTFLTLWHQGVVRRYW